MTAPALEAECKRCGGEGFVFTRENFHDCADCGGEGWIECSQGGVKCPFTHCYCEAAWEREQEDKSSWG